MMTSYDSDSSFDDDDFTETNVLLGYASKEPTGDEISQLGGHPVCFSPIDQSSIRANKYFQAWLDERTAPSGAFAKCKVCNSLMSLLLQLNGDLPSRFPDHERRLYLFTCRRKACRRKDGSIRGIRGNRITKSKEVSMSKVDTEVLQSADPAADIGATLFGVSSSSTSKSANPFSSSPVSTSTNLFASAKTLAAKPPQKPCDPTSGLSETFADKARISAPTSTSTTRPEEPWPPQSAFPPPFPQWHLDAEYEALSAPASAPAPRQATLDGDAEMGEASGAEDPQLFESSMDAAFQRFADRLAHSPDQVLRYEFAGAPLLYAADDAVGRLLGAHSRVAGAAEDAGLGAAAARMPRCANCAAERVFEVQLVPHAIAVLEEEEDVGLDGMDWGTVILGVCSKDCSAKGCANGEVGYLEEWVGVQWEELAKKNV